MLYPYKKYQVSNLGRNNRGFVVPFLLGGLFGGALGSAWRPNNYYPQNPGFNPYYPASNYSYSYYVPQYVPNPNLYS